METIKLEEFHHKINLNIRYMDIDSMHHVNNARYLNFLEEARIDYSQNVMGGLENINQLSIVVARIEIDYMKPIFFGEKVIVHNRIVKVGQKSIHFESIIEVIGEQHKVAARAIQILVAIDPATGKSTKITDKVRKKIEKFENL